jgi:hypothetical protein
VSDVPADWHLDSPSRAGYFRQLAHKLIHVGYQFSIQQLEPSKRYEEPEITGFIRQGIRDYTFTNPGFDGFYSEENRPEITANNTRIGKGRNMPDLVIQYTNHPRLELVCEAKRLNSSSGRTDYVGSDGMGCFISGIYASDQSEAAMIGYVETKSITEWKQIVCQHIQDKSTELSILGNQEDVQIIGAFSDEWQSKHHRSPLNQPIAILHILLDYIR